jgi:uncharacterized protein YndB with AHSA1/START domain
MRITETFVVNAPPEAVFDYMTAPSNLTSWQTSTTSVEQLTDGPPGLGTRVRERIKPPGADEFEQVVEYIEFARPQRLRVHVVEGPYPIEGTWSLEPRDGGTTRVRFAAEGELRGAMRLMGPLAARMIARQFAGYHRELRQNVEAL